MGFLISSAALIVETTAEEDGAASGMGAAKVVILWMGGDIARVRRNPGTDENWSMQQAVYGTYRTSYRQVPYGT